MRWSPTTGHVRDAGEPAPVTSRSTRPDEDENPDTGVGERDARGCDGAITVFGPVGRYPARHPGRTGTAGAAPAPGREWEFRMVVRGKLAAVETLLRTAARTNTLCPFSSLYALFEEGTASGDVYDTLERASLSLAPSEVAIYSALMAKKKTLVPGSGFFDIFRIVRHSEYERLAGPDVHPVELTDAQMRAIALQERLRVYRHARDSW